LMRSRAACSFRCRNVNLGLGARDCRVDNVAMS
jgi:hypothetical protein